VTPLEVATTANRFETVVAAAAALKAPEAPVRHVTEKGLEALNQLMATLGSIRERHAVMVTDHADVVARAPDAEQEILLAATRVGLAQRHGHAIIVSRHGTIELPLKHVDDGHELPVHDVARRLQEGVLHVPPAGSTERNSVRILASKQSVDELAQVVPVPAECFLPHAQRRALVHLLGEEATADTGLQGSERVVNRRIDSRTTEIDGNPAVSHLGLLGRVPIPTPVRKFSSRDTVLYYNIN
jgi:hypothetical protein